jgi:hypothetical protein
VKARDTRRPASHAPMQPESEFPARESKGIQEKRLGFPWIPLVESRPFNALQRKKIKKSPSAQLASWVVPTVARRAVSPDSSDQPICPSENHIPHILDFENRMYSAGHVADCEITIYA